MPLGKVWLENLETFGIFPWSALKRLSRYAFSSLIFYIDICTKIYKVLKPPHFALSIPQNPIAYSTLLLVTRWYYLADVPIVNEFHQVFAHLLQWSLWSADLWANFTAKLNPSTDEQWWKPCLVVLYWGLLYDPVRSYMGILGYYMIYMDPC